MKNLILVFVLITAVGKSQTCNQATLNPNYTYTTGGVFMVPNINTASMFICPNATVGDSSTAPISCRNVVVSAGAFYAYRQKGTCMSAIHALGNSTVYIAPFSTGNGIYLEKEPGATVINASTLTINTTTCSSIPVPTINCTGSSGITEISVKGGLFSVYPNPANDKITIEAAWGNSFNEAEISITNLLGSVVYDKRSVGGQKLEIDLKNLQSGVYYLSVNTNSFKETRKIIVSK